LPSDAKPNRNVTSAYRINNEDIKKLTNTTMKTVRGIISDFEGGCSNEKQM
jgi:hypothetical protein